jgi:hypothetical protein
MGKEIIMRQNIIFVMILFMLPTWTHADVQRNIVQNSQCGQATIRLTIQPEQDVQSYALVENIPWIATPSNISHEGFWDEAHRVIRWGTFLDHDPRTISYILTSEDGTYSLDGTISLTGKTESISGLSEFTADCTPKPLPKPTFSPTTGTKVPVTVSIQCSVTDAEIYYSLDTNDPEKGQANTFLYTQPLVLSQSTYIKARAYKTGMLPGKVASARYPEPDLQLGEINRQIVHGDDCTATISISLTPVASVESFAMAEILSIGLVPTQISHDGFWDQQHQTIRWGTFMDHSPKKLSYTLESQYIGQFTLDATVSFMGKTLTQQSEIIFDCIPQPEQVAMPTVQPPDGTEVPLDVSIYCDTTGATIYYTTNGTEPDMSSIKYTGPIHLTQATQLIIKAIKEGYRDSEILTVSYIEPSLPQPVAKRQINNEDLCHPTVVLTITPQNHIETWAIEEFLPDGIHPTHISDDGYWDAPNNTIRWGTILDNTEQNLSYQLQSSQVVQTVELSGNISFMGSTYATAGDYQTQIDCTPDIVEAPNLSHPDGSRAPLLLVMTCNTPDAFIYYTTDGTSPDETCFMYTEPVDIVDTTTINAIAVKSGMENSRIIEATYIRYVDKAIIVAGGSLNDPLWYATLKCANFAYLALMYRGYKESQLRYLNSDMRIDVDSNGDDEDDIYGLSTSDNLKTAIISWASDAKNLVIYLIDHGGPGTFLINENEVLKASDLDEWMDQAESRLPGKLYFIYDACYSGSFIKQLKTESILDSRRIIMTSASSEDAYLLHNGAMSFSYQFWAALFESPYVYAAFTQATSMMHAYQHPLLDADGDGIANEKNDGYITRDLIIGTDGLTANARPKVLINQKCLIVNNDTTQTFITENIVTLHPVQKVWATIVPPKQLTTGQPVLILPEIDMEFNGKEGQYAGIYSDFYENGLYKVSIYAQDKQGMISLPAIIHVFSGGISQWKGDMNMDQVVDLSDVIIGLQMLSDITSLETCGAVVSDGDDVIDMIDILRVLKNISE